MSNWEGVAEVAENHRTLGERAWCHTDREKCYPTYKCQCCREAEGWVQLWLKPDGTIVDDDGNVMTQHKVAVEDVNVELEHEHNWLPRGEYDLIDVCAACGQTRLIESETP